jgi:hypothetical protein
MIRRPPTIDDFERDRLRAARDVRDAREERLFGAARRAGGPALGSEDLLLRRLRMPLSRFALPTASSLLPLAILVAVAGCSSDLDLGTGSGAGGAGATSSGPGSTSSGGGPDAGVKLTTIAKTIGLITAESGGEGTKCITVNLNNPEGLYALRFRSDLSTGTHHLIAYTSNQTVEAPDPKNCEPFSGILTGEHPIFIAQQPQAQLVFPTDDDGTPVGFELKPNQMIKLEMHYFNTSDFPLDIMGKVSFDTVPLSTSVTKSDLAFWGTTKINIPANSAGETPVLFQRALAGTKTFALTTHQHHLGTQMQVWYAEGVSDPNKKEVANGQNWADPPLELFSPPLDFPENGGSSLSSKGLAFQCKWNNTTPNTVYFGEGYNDEMCFTWQYYFPSQGFQLCLDGTCGTVD